ncbi:MAG TPA: vitamin B12 dependent-methionine synthase activation domain-containing protein [Bacteroidales bacterium]|nr:vitamin B12 dependent-methionine synthase activation domain-containing protein [Bacteroidales bacterium]
MTDKRFQFAFNDLGINISEIEKLLGYDEGADREMVKALIEETLNDASAIGSIRSEYRIFRDIKFDDDDKSLNINNITFDIQKIIFNQIKKSESIAVFISTAGAEIGEKSREVMAAGDPLKGYILDIIGSLIVDTAADLMQDDLALSAGLTGQKITNRYSPGYCGWNVAEQHKLFSLLPDNFCRITLTESALMFPVKSASGFIGIGEHVRYNRYTCSLCDMPDCTYRGLRNEKEESKNR